MNNALVKIEGSLVSRPYIRVGQAGEEYASFVISDGTGSVRVSLSGADAVEFSKQVNVHQNGSRIQACGILQVREGEDYKLFARNVGGDGSWKPLM